MADARRGRWRGRVVAGEQVVEHRHAHRDTGRDLVEHDGLGCVGGLGRDLEAAVHRAGVEHEHVVVAGHEPVEPVAGQPVADGVLARRREVAAAHPLALDAQHHDRVDGIVAVEHRVEVPARGEAVGGAPRADAARHERGRGDDRDPGAERPAG